MKKIVLFLVKSLALILYMISHLFPRNKKRWVFGEPHGFNNNSKYLFLDILESHPEIDAAWIGDAKTVKMLKEKRLTAYERWSLRGLYYCMTSKVYVVSWTTGDINFYLSGGASIVNLWHGTPLKKCRWLVDTYIRREGGNAIHRFLNRVYVPVLYYGKVILNSPSSFYTDIFMDMFRVNRKYVIEDIYPRNRFMMKSKNEIISFLERYGYNDDLSLIKKLAVYERIILYAPTFRDSGKDFVAYSGLDFVELDRKLANYNYYFIVKLHPATNCDRTRFQGLKNILFLSNKYDLYPLMPFTDLLISDYSSILFDYMLLDKKVIAFTFDYMEYVKECRELICDIKEGLDGIPLVNNAKELVDMILGDENKIPSPTSELYRKCWEPSANLVNRVLIASGNAV